MSILVNTGFKVGSAEPLNELSIRETVADRDALVTDGLAYEGMKVYCKDTKLEYRYTGVGWDEIGSGTGSSYDDTEVRRLIDTNKTNIATNTTKIDELTIKIGNTTMDTTATDITGAINEVNGNLLDNVSFSADYKNILLNRKNGTNPYPIPMSAIINHANLIELADIDSTDIGNNKTLVYDTTAQKHKYVDSTGTDEFVKMDSTTDAHYLADLIDKSTVINDNGVLKVKKLDGQEVTITEINYLKGLTMNVMDLVNAFANGGVKVLSTPLNTASELSTMDRSAFIDGISYIIYVLADENHAGAKTTYLVDKTNTTFFGNADNQRDFTTNPLNLANEVTDKLGTSNIDVDSLWSLLTIDDTYKTLTTTNNIFGTHGAKAMYDELIIDIGNKANKDSVDAHIGDATIHISQAEKNSYALKNEIISMDNIAHIKRFYSVPDNDWNNAIEEGYYSIAFDSVANKIANRPYDYAIQVHVIKADTNDPIFIYQIAYVSISDSRIYIRKQKIDGSWTPWGIIRTTTVADVGKTTITPASNSVTGTIKYTVKNGICYVSFKNVKSTTNGTFLISPTMPKPDISCSIGIINDAGNYITGCAYIDENTTNIRATFYNTSYAGSCSFSYPVAES